MGKCFVVAALALMGATALGEPPAIEPPLVPAPRRDGPPVGFVTHPHMENHGNMQALAGFPATAELTNVFGWRMVREPRPDVDPTPGDLLVDFAIPGDWLREVYRSGRTAYPILDTGIQHSEVKWRGELTRRAGHNVVGYDGVTRHWSSFHSPVYLESVFQYIDQLIDWVKKNDTDRRVPGYIDGAEWFWPYGTHDFSPLALEAFRAWLQDRYASIEALNAAWGSAFIDWASVEPVRPYGAGENNTGYGTYSLGGPAVYTWSSPAFPVTTDVDLAITVDYATTDVAEGLADVVALWLDADGKPINLSAFSVNDEAPAGRFEADVRPPRALAERPTVPAAMRLFLRLSGGGTVDYKVPQVRNMLTEENILPAEGWTSDGKATKFFSVTVGGPLLYRITGAIPSPPYSHSGVAHEDWLQFTYESFADWLNTTARHIKERDPSRQVASYVGWVFAMQSQWEGANQEQRLDISLANTPDIDVNGIQMCIAGDDYTNATFLVDMARKYGKPIWVTDLIDFPYGLFSGFEPIYRASLACVQHGLDGFFYYNWWGTKDYSYSDHLAAGDLERMLSHDRAAIDAVGSLTPVIDAAVISPIMSFSLHDEGGRKGDPRDAGGLYRMVLDMGITPDLWTPYEISKQGAGALGRYKAIFLSDCPVLPNDVNAALIGYVKQGGTLVISGRAPEKDLAGALLAECLVKDATPGAVALEKGHVILLGDRVGRAYWGRIRREAVYGNTPAVAVEIPDPNRTPEARRVQRLRLAALLDEAGVTLPVEIGLDSGNVHASLHADGAGGYALFLVHKGSGRIYDLPVTLHLGTPTSLQVSTDFEKSATVPVDDKGQTVLPAFTHSAVVRILR